MITAIENLLNSKDYDIRKSHNGRWIDQKCTADMINIIADCIDNFVDKDKNLEFTIKDIWNSEYVKENVASIFGKPSTDNSSAKNEYDKFFSQPIKLLANAGILKEFRKGSNANSYKITNREILDFIALRESNALNFLILYIEKVLKDSELYSLFDEFFNKQDKDSFKDLKDNFIDFTQKNTAIKREFEPKRIFTKVLNPLAYKRKKYGTHKGNLSKKIITLDEIRYNRPNFRDFDKDKSMARKDFSKPEPIQKYHVNKAKNDVKKYNKKWNNSLSEIKSENENNIEATQMHHIFPISDFPILSDYIENIIAITPNQHFSMAHPSNSTKYIDKNFQYICLLAKTNTIIQDLQEHLGFETYSFENYIIVLNTGLKTNEFDSIPELDFKALIDKIDYFYDDFDGSKYGDLLDQNKQGQK